MVKLEAILTGLKSSDTDEKTLALDHLKTLLDKDTAKDILNGAATDDVVHLLASHIKANQILLSLKAIAVSGPVLSHLVSLGRPLKRYLFSVIPALIDRLGDGKEKLRDSALDSLVTCWDVLYSPTKSAKLPHGDKIIEDFSGMVIKGMKHKTPRIRELCIGWCLNCADKDEKFPLTKFTVPVLILAEDTNEAVREKANVVSDETRDSLQRTLTKTKVKKTLADQLTVRLIKGAHETENTTVTTSNHRHTASGTAVPSSLDLFETDPTQSKSPPYGKSPSEKSIPGPRSSVSSFRSPHISDEIEPINVYDAKDLQKKLTEIIKAFIGKETDLNWGVRDHSMQVFRQILRGNAMGTWPEIVMGSMKEFIDGLDRTLLSVRTALVSSGLNLITDLCAILPEGTLDPFYHVLFPTLLKCAASTKKSQAELAHSTTLLYINRTGFQLKTLSLICDAITDRSVQIRTFALSYLLAFLKRHGKSKSQLFEKKGLIVGLDLITKSLKKALSDANPKARDLARQCFSMYRDIWPKHAQGFLATLEPSLRKTLAPSHEEPSPVKSSQSKDRLTNSSRLSKRSSHYSLTQSNLHSKPKPVSQTVASSRGPPSRSALGVTGIPDRCASAMMTGAESRQLRSSRNTVTERSPSAFNLTRPNRIDSPRSSLLPVPKSSDHQLIYSPPRDLNSGKLATDPGVSRIPRPPLRFSNPSSLDDIIESEPQPPISSRIPFPRSQTPAGTKLRNSSLSRTSHSSLTPSKSNTPNLTPKSRPASVMSGPSKPRSVAFRSPSSMGRVSHPESFRGTSNLRPRLNSQDSSPTEENNASNGLANRLKKSMSTRDLKRNSGSFNSNLTLSLNSSPGSNSNSNYIDKPLNGNADINSPQQAFKEISLNSPIGITSPGHKPNGDHAHPIRTSENDVQKLIDLVSTRASPADFLRLNRLSREYTEDHPSFKKVWFQNQNIIRLTKNCLTLMQKPDATWDQREPGVVLLESLIRNQGQLIDSLASEILTVLMESSRDPAPNASSVVEDALIAFAQSIEVHCCITTTIRFLHACLLIDKGSLPEMEDFATPTASGFLILIHAVPRLTAAEVYRFQLDLDSLVGTGFHHTVSVVRHHTLSLVLAIDKLLGSGHLEEFFTRLTSSQLRLVNMYLDSW